MNADALSIILKDAERKGWNDAVEAVSKIVGKELAEVVRRMKK